tara:strand:- start:478 stop:1233 length:756 start_codon:yes stop_codon:yes gene_type:complete
MARKSKGKFKMKGHALPGINQKSETPPMKDGRSASSAFQYASPMKDMKTGKYEQAFAKYINNTVFKQSEIKDNLTEEQKMEKLRDFLLSEEVGLQSLEGVDDWVKNQGGISEAYEEMLRMSKDVDVPAEPKTNIEQGVGEGASEFVGETIKTPGIEQSTGEQFTTGTNIEQGVRSAWSEDDWDTDGDRRMNDEERLAFLKSLGLTEKEMQVEMSRLAEEYGDDDYDLDQYVQAANDLSKKKAKSSPHIPKM